MKRISRARDFVLFGVLMFALPFLLGASVSGGGGGGGGGGGTLDQAFDGGKVIDGANSVANALRVGDGVTPICLYTDATLKGIIKPCVDSNTRRYIWNGFTDGWFDIEGDADMFVIDPDAATKKEMYAFKAGYYPMKSFYLNANFFNGDGTNCPARPTIVTISNMLYPTFICTENNSSRMKTGIPMPGDWDGGTILIEPMYAQTAADTGSVALEVAAACRAFGTAFNGTYGTEVEVDDAVLVGSGAIEATLSTAVTPNGTCAANDMLFLYIDVDSTDNPTTAAATLNFLGAKVLYNSVSLSHR